MQIEQTDKYRELQDFGLAITQVNLFDRTREQKLRDRKNRQIFPQDWKRPARANPFIVGTSAF